MGTVITVASGKGGTGKTSAVAAIASILAVLGNKTLCLDADIGLKNLDIILGLSDRAVKDFRDVIDGLCSLEDAACAHPQIENLFLLTAPSYASPESINVKAMSSLIDEIRAKYDYCLIDAPAGIGTGFKLASAFADWALVASGVAPASLRDAQRVNIELQHLGIKKTHLIVNRVRPRLMKKVSLTIDDAIDESGLQLIGIVPEDKDVIITGDMGVPLILRSDKDAARAYLNITKRITGEQVPLMKIKRI